MRPSKVKNSIDLNEDIPDEVLEEEVNIRKEREAKARKTVDDIKPQTKPIEPVKPEPQPQDDWDDLI